MGRLTNAVKALAGKDAGGYAVEKPCTCITETKKQNKHMSTTRIRVFDKNCPKHKGMDSKSWEDEW